MLRTPVRITDLRWIVGTGAKFHNAILGIPSISISNSTYVAGSTDAEAIAARWRTGAAGRFNTSCKALCWATNRTSRTSRGLEKARKTRLCQTIILLPQVPRSD